MYSSTVVQRSLCSRDGLVLSARSGLPAERAKHLTADLCCECSKSCTVCLPSVSSCRQLCGLVLAPRRLRAVLDVTRHLRHSSPSAPAAELGSLPGVMSCTITFLSVRGDPYGLCARCTLVWLTGSTVAAVHSSLAPSMQRALAPFSPRAAHCHATMCMLLRLCALSSLHVLLCNMLPMPCPGPKQLVCFELCATVLQYLSLAMPQP